jgi:hypothetical protein
MPLPKIDRAALLRGFAAVSPGEPREICRRQLCLRAAGGKADPAVLAPHRGNPDHLAENAGSGNWPWVAAAALDDFDWLARAISHEQRTGLGGVEGGSWGYGADVVAAKVWALARARSIDHPVCRALGENLAAQCALFALSAAPWPQRSVVECSNDGRGGIDYATIARGIGHPFYSGLYSTLPPPRQNADYTPRFSAALSWGVFGAGRWTRLGKWRDDQVSTQGDWPLRVIELALGRPYGAPNVSTFFGLPDADAESLAGMQGEERLGDVALRVLGAYKPWGTLTIARGANEILSWVSAGWSTFKPHVLAVGRNSEGDTTLARPQVWRKDGASKGFTRREGERIFCAADGSTVILSLPEGAQVYELAGATVS